MSDENYCDNATNTSAIVEERIGRLERQEAQRAQERVDKLRISGFRIYGLVQGMEIEIMWSIQNAAIQNTAIMKLLEKYNEDI